MHALPEGLTGAVLGIVASIIALLWMRHAIAIAWTPLRQRYPSTNVDREGEITKSSLHIRISRFENLIFNFSVALKISARSVHLRPYCAFLFQPIDLPFTAFREVRLIQTKLGDRAIVHLHDYPYALVFYRSPAQLIHRCWLQQQRPETANAAC